MRGSNISPAEFAQQKSVSCVSDIIMHRTECWTILWIFTSWKQWIDAGKCNKNERKKKKKKMELLQCVPNQHVPAYARQLILLQQADSLFAGCCFVEHYLQISFRFFGSKRIILSISPYAIEQWRRKLHVVGSFAFELDDSHSRAHTLQTLLIKTLMQKQFFYCRAADDAAVVVVVVVRFWCKSVDTPSSTLLKWLTILYGLVHLDTNQFIYYCF